MDRYFVSVRKIAKKNLSNIQPILTSCLVNNAYIPYLLEQAPERLFKISAERGGGRLFSFLSTNRNFILATS